MRIKKFSYHFQLQPVAAALAGDKKKSWGRGGKRKSGKNNNRRRNDKSNQNSNNNDRKNSNRNKKREERREKSKNKSNRKQQQQQQAEESGKDRQARHLSERQTSKIDNGNNINQSESFDDDLQNGREAKNPSLETIETSEARSGEQNVENRETHKMEVGELTTGSYGHLNYTLELEGMLGFDNLELSRGAGQKVKQRQQHLHRHRHNHHLYPQ